MASDHQMDPCTLLGLHHSAMERNRHDGFFTGSRSMPWLFSWILRAAVPGNDVLVRIFDRSVEEGRPARRLYHSFGFRDHRSCEPTPTGFATVIMIREEG